MYADAMYVYAQIIAYAQTMLIVKNVACLF